MHFSEEVLIEILSRLPANSLVRFRCVSKSWKTLITSPDFIKTHFHHSKQFPSNLILNFEDNGLPKLAIRLPDHIDVSHLNPPPPLVDNPANKFELIDSINGIVCLSTPPFPRKISKVVSSRTFLWNPAIKECFTVPEPQALGSNFLNGFGFNTLSSHLDDFKVVNINLCYENEGPFHWSRSSQVHLYSIRTDSWTYLGDCFPSWIGGRTRNQVVFEEFICWFPHALYGHKEHEALVCFDVVKGEFLQLAKPNPLLENNYVALLDGCVSLLASCPLQGYEVWVMKEFGNVKSWTKLYTIEVLARGVCFYRPLGFVNSDEVLFSRYFTVGRRFKPSVYLRSYDVRGRKFKDRCSKVKVDSFYSCRLGLYAESLIRLGRV